MKKFFQIVLTLLLLTLPFNGQDFRIPKAWAASPSPHWPSARAMLWLSSVGGTDSEQKATYSWEAQHYDFMIAVGAGYVDYIRSVNPTVGGVGIYEQFLAAIAGSKQEQAIQDQATRLGLNAEDAYLHLKADTVSRLTSSTDVSQTYPWLKWNSTTQKVTIPGWDPANDRNGDGYVDDTEFASLANPNATARSRNQARWSDWSWNPPQWKLNLGAFDLVKSVIDLIADRLAAPALAGQSTSFGVIGFDGVDGYYGFGSSFYEYPRATGGNPDTEFASDMAALVRYTKQLYGGQVLIFGNSLGGNWTVDKELDGMYREMYLSTYWTSDGWETGLHPFSSTSPYYRARQAGKIQGLQIQYNTLGAGDTPENWVKERIFGVAAYYLLQNPGKDYWAAWNSVAYWPSISENEKMWSHALEVDIGQPTGHTPDGATVIAPWGVWTFATGADPGHPDYPDITKSYFKIYAREYTKGLILLKPRSGTATYPGSRNADNTATTHDLPVTSDNPSGRYFQVKDDGTIETTPLTTITLRNGEAAVLVKESALTQPTISKSVDKSSATSGDTLTYTISYTVGNQNVTNAKIEDNIPNGTTFVAGSATGGGNSDGTKVIWNLGNLAPGATGSLQFKVRVE